MNVQPDTVSDPIVLRSWLLIVSCWLAAIGSLVVFIVTAATGPGPNPGPIDYIGTVAFGLIMSAGFLRATRMRVELDDDGITAFNWLTTRSVPWEHVAGATADYNGLHIVGQDGTVVTAGSLGKPNWANWFGKRVAADERVGVVERELARRLSN